MKNRIKNYFREDIFDFRNKNMLHAIVVTPFFHVRRNLYRNIKYFSEKMCGSILDFGCGAKPYRELFTNCTDYIGVDIDVSGHDHTDEKIDVYYDGYTLPFADHEFDNIFTSEVFEHVSNLDHILDELHRVICPGGLMLVSVPFVWNEHEIPYDFRRYTSFGIEAILEEHGFEIIEIRKSTSCIEMIYQMKAEYYRYVFKDKNRFMRVVVQCTLIALQSIKGIVLGKLLPTNWSFYGDNIVLCKSI